MGLSSNARLLTITARLTSNEYESQQITNAKLRLATQSQEASEDYIRALNTQAFNFVTYDSYGNSVNTGLTANVLYQYADSKNQYVLANASGQALISSQDAENFKKSGTLQQFLACYGINPTYKSSSSQETNQGETLAQLAKAIDDYTDSNGKTKWENKIDSLMTNDPIANLTEYKVGSRRTLTDVNVYSQWLADKDDFQNNYIEERKKYTRMIYNFQNYKENISRSDIDEEKEKLADKYTDFLRTVNFGSFIEYQCYHEHSTTGELTYTSLKDSSGNVLVSTDEIKQYHQYLDNLEKYNAMLENIGIEPQDAYTYEDKTKAQWYTNLWYRLNGASTVKTQDKNYQVLETELLSSSSWIRDSLSQGLITIEQAGYTNSANTIPNPSNPVMMNLTGITWATKQFGSCPDIVQTDDDAAIAKAEAEYEKKTTEINIKDEKFQRKINLLNSEHSALQAEYESVKSALDKNISRSFKTFSS